MSNDNFNETQEPNAANQAGKLNAAGTGNENPGKPPQNETDLPGAIEYVVEDEDKPMSIIQRTANIFLSPGKLMENLNRYPKMLSPIIVFLLVGAVTAVIYALYPQITQIALDEQSLMMIERYGVDITSIGMENMGEYESLINMTTIATAFVSAVIGPYISSFFSAVILLILSLILRVKSKFTQYYSMYVHISMVTAVLTLITTVFMIITDSTVNVLSLGMLMPGGNMLDVLYMILTSISVANIWQAVLVCIGLKAFTGCSNAKAVTISAISLALTVAYAAGSAYAMGAYYDFLYGIIGQM